MAKQNSRVTTADKIATLIRIHRAAIHCNDKTLAESARSELRTHGIYVASDLVITIEQGDCCS